jgi:small neutral amino acid transporter SnatA (MarC family)
VTTTLLAVAALAALNPARTRLGIPETARGRARMGPLVLGTVLGVGGAAVAAALSGPLLEALEITPETFRIAAGLVLAIAGLRTVVWPRPAEEPALEGRRSALWPVAFPRVFSPEVAALALTAGSIEGVAPTIAVLAGAGAVLMLLGVVPRRPVADGVLRWVGAILAVLLVAAAAFVMIDGIRDV